jgi:hypothetical protein
MAAKDVLKHWVTRIDNALLKEEKRRGTHHAPAPSAPGEPSPTRREAVVAEDMHIGETDTTTLRSAIQSLRDHTTGPVDIDANIYALIAPTDIQITSPHTIAPALLQPFKTGAKEVTLIFLTGKKTTSAIVHTMHRTHMFVGMD